MIGAHGGKTRIASLNGDENCEQSGNKGPLIEAI